MFLLKAKSKPTSSPRKRRRYEAYLPPVKPVGVKRDEQKKFEESKGTKTKKIVAERNPFGEPDVDMERK